jgi:hypothetical protein
MRRRFPLRRGARKRSMIWVNIPFTHVINETASFALLLLPEDWERAFTGTANETATLVGIKGVVGWVQTANATLGIPAFWGLAIQDKDATVSPSFSVAGMGDVDWLHVDSFFAHATAVGTNAPIQREQFHTSVKRKLKSRDAVIITGQFGADAGANPIATLGGVLRFLVAIG